MQRKTINKRIKNKMEEWLATLPENLSKKVRPNIVVSGGSIASMFLREDVNDYDVYLMDMDVLFELCKFYGDKHDVGTLDGRKRDQMLQDEYGWTPGEPVPTFQEEGDYQSERFVRLRSLRNDQIKMDTGTGKRINQTKNTNENGETIPFSVKFISPNAISLNNDVQVVCRFSGSVEDIHRTFDFIHATNYFTFETGVVTNIQALESLLTKQLKYQGSLYPVTSIIRAKKFIKRGWNIGAGEYLKIMFQISELMLTDPVVLEDQLIGVDVAYFGMLIDILKAKYEKEPDFKLTSPYLNEVIDKVFNEDLDDDSHPDQMNFDV
jgi:hypothetical protein